MKNAHKRRNRIRIFRRVISWSGARQISFVIFIKAFIRARCKSANCHSVFFNPILKHLLISLPNLSWGEMLPESKCSLLQLRKDF